MKAIYRQLLEKSVAAALAGIEVYNKPDFRYREETFVILCVNAWELLLKAKILKDAGNKVRSLYVYQGSRVKRSRTGNPLTIEILAAMKKAKLATAVVDNLTALIDIRDTAVHFYSNDSLRYVVYCLGVAALQNYQRLVKNWFKHSLLDYNFYIMPLGFSHDFKTLKMLDFEKSPPLVANLVKSVAEVQQRSPSEGPYYFACEIGTEIKSAKKFASGADLTVKIDQDAEDAAVVITRWKRKLDQYPLSYKELIERLKKMHKDARPNQINKIIKQFKVKGNDALAEYSFRTKTQEDQYKKSGKLPKAIASIYNEDAVRFIVQKLDEADGA